MAEPVTEYWIELSSDLLEQADFEEWLKSAGVALVRKGPVYSPWAAYRQHMFCLVSDPEAPEDLRDKTVDLVLTRAAVVGSSPPAYTTKITERKAR